MTNLSSRSFSRTGKLVRGNDLVANVEKEISRRTRERDLDSVRTMSDRQNLHEFMERQAESAVR